MGIILWLIGIYLVIGVLLQIFVFSEIPETDGWLWAVLLWPLVIAAIMFG